MLKILVLILLLNAKHAQQVAFDNDAWSRARLMNESAVNYPQAIDLES
ncbi:hypothetical protein ACVDG5_036685 [Mesorhizobium sp. ORM6]